MGPFLCLVEKIHKAYCTAYPYPMLPLLYMKTASISPSKASPAHFVTFSSRQLHQNSCRLFATSHSPPSDTLNREDKAQLSYIAPQEGTRRNRKLSMFVNSIQQSTAIYLLKKGRGKLKATEKHNTVQENQKRKWRMMDLCPCHLIPNGTAFSTDK